MIHDQTLEHGKVKWSIKINLLFVKHKLLEFFFFKLPVINNIAISEYYSFYKNPILITCK